MSALIRAYAGRPSVVTVDGCRVYVGVHDAEHLRIRSEAKRRLAALHPDAPGGTPRKFREAAAQHERWLAKEKAWYAFVGVEPPLAIPAHIGAPEDDDRLITIRCATCSRPYVIVKDTKATICSYCRRRKKAPVSRPPMEPVNLRSIVQDTERRYIEHALESADNNRSVAARLLGLPRASFLDLIKRHRSTATGV